MHRKIDDELILIVEQNKPGTTLYVAFFLNWRGLHFYKEFCGQLAQSLLDRINHP